MVGRASGRPSPRVPHRLPAREATLVAHGLMEPGTADVNQGQLFSTAQFQRPVADVAREAGVAPPLASSVGGFLPDITGSPSGGRSAHRRKAEALQKFAEVRSAHPVDAGPGLGGAQARHMAHLQQLSDTAPEGTSWYTTRDPETGHVGPGSSVTGIEQASQRTNTPMAAMTRATAQISPRVPWSRGNPNYRGYPNLESAEGVARTVRERESRFPGRQAREATLERLGQEAPGIALPLSKSRAAVSVGTPGVTSTPLPTGENFAKVPNFNESLSVGQTQIPTAVRAQYAGAYTSDMWDLAAKGLPESFHKKQGAYSVDKMLSTRTAFKNRELPSKLQERTWEQHRGALDPEPLTASIDVSGRGDYRPAPSLLNEDQITGKLSPSFDFRRSSHGAVPERRSATAARLGLDF
jgi:hypothetical protein